MTARDLTARDREFPGDDRPNPLVDARYGVAYTASLGMFDTAGWTPPAAGTYAGFGDDGVALGAQFDGRRDYGPRGCVGIVVGAVVFLAVFVAVALVVAIGGA